MDGGDSVPSLYGYTAAGLMSVFYGQGVKMDWGQFSPTQDNACALGGSSRRWSAVYAANGTIQTSDLLAKTDVGDGFLGLDFVLSLKPRRYRMKESGNLTGGDVEEITEEDGTVIKRIRPGSQLVIPGQRFHEGLISQEVKNSLDQFGVDSAMWVRSDDGREGLRYEELIAPLVLAVQQLTAEVRGRRE